MPAAKSQNVRRAFLLSRLAIITTSLSCDVAGNTSSRSPRCRFHATFEGFEWFIYNRTAAFDNIVAQMDAKTPVPERCAQSPAADGAASQRRQIFTKSSAGGDSAYSTPSFLSGIPNSFVLV